MPATERQLERARLILADYPGPVRLPQPKYQLVLGIVTFSIATAFGFLIVLRGEEIFRNAIWIGYAIIVLGIPLTFMAIVSLFAGGSRLVLDKAGFRISHPVFERHKWLVWNIYDLVPWREAAEFKPFKRRQIQFTRSLEEADGWWERYCRRALSGLPAYGLPAEELSAVMNEWRERALAEPPRSSQP